MSMVMFDGDTVTVRPWIDETLDRVGYDPRSPYVERFWLGIIGPSVTWLIRRMASGFDAAPDGFEMPLGETARALGLGDSGGRNSAFFRTLNRMVQFDLARVTGPGELQVMRRLPPLTRRQAARLSPALQEAHERWQAARLAVPDAEAARRRSRQLALSLLELGESADEVERQLMRWRYHPAMARESLCWAVDRHREAVGEAGGATAGATPHATAGATPHATAGATPHATAGATPHATAG
ncbi:MAG: hypothetical protein M0Z30_24605, partial [Actinomycetota bacterium]|nr:hypothetical protein [Actinomycetota bacterium]